MDVVDLDRRAVDRLPDTLAATSLDDFGRETPCPGWDVADLVAHLVSGNVKYTDITRGGDWARGVPDVDAGADPVGTYRRTAATMLAAWSRPGALDREIQLPRGRGRAEAALHLHLGETLVHGWDLAVATGRSAVFDVDVVEASLAQYMSWLPPARAGQAPFEDATDVPADAPAIDRLAGYLGRRVDAWRT